MIWKQVVRHIYRYIDIKVVQWKPSGEGRGGWVSRECKKYND